MPILPLALAAAAALPCPALPGADAFARSTRARWVLLGESQHGTVEQPEAARGLICAFIRAGRPLIVAVEHPATEQPLLDAYMASDGSVSAKAALLRASNWSPDRADGKSSESMLALLDWLRIHHQLGQVDAVVAFDAAFVSAHSGPGLTTTLNSDRNAQMTTNLARLVSKPGGVVVALTGSYHAQVKMALDRGVPVPTPGAALPREARVSLLIQADGGTAWMCLEDGCGVHQVGRRHSAGRRLHLVPTRDGLYDGVIDVGGPETASPPAQRASRPSAGS